MKLKVTRTDIWTATIDDRSGAAADKLEPLAKAGANLEFLLARRTPEQPGKGLCLVSPVKGKKVVAAATAAGFAKAPDLVGLRVEGGNKAGTGARMTKALGDAGISFRALSASVLGSKFVCYISFDNAADADAAAKVLKKV